VRVTVTAKDIVKGRRSIADRCPVALALRHMTHRRWEVYFTALQDVTRRRGVAAPPRVAEWCEQYDDGLNVKPFAFELVT
jgi:hypothetical protein